MYVWDVNPTVTKHYFVWKDTSACVTRRCGDTVDKKRVTSCVLKHLFFGGSWATKNIDQKPRNALSNELLIDVAIIPADPTWGDIIECCFQAQSSKLERLFGHVLVKRDVWALSFELWKSFQECHPKWDWLYLVRNSLIALLEALYAELMSRFHNFAADAAED